MTTDETDTTKVPGTPDPVEGLDQGHPFESSSIVDIFKQEAQELADIKEVYIPIKGYERTGLSARYGMPESGKLIDDIGRRVFRETKGSYERNLFITMDVMAHLCEGLYIKDPNNPDENIMFDADQSGVPMTYDSRLAELLGFDLEEPTARQVIKRLFGGKEMAVIDHGQRLNRWLNDAKADVVSEFWQLGED